jgi:MoxR-like ATPase
LVLGAKARAVLHGRPTPGIEDVKAIAPAVLRHRVVTNFSAEAEGINADHLVARLLEEIKE